MSIITENQYVKADVAMATGYLAIDFAEDACFTRSETVLIDLMHRSIGVIFQNGYHHIGDLPSGLAGPAMQGLRNARLSGYGGDGREIVLHAPLKIVM
jgi:hypothetical protein